MSVMTHIAKPQRGLFSRRQGSAALGVDVDFQRRKIGVGRQMQLRRFSMMKRFDLRLILRHSIWTLAKMIVAILGSDIPSLVESRISMWRLSDVTIQRTNLDGKWAPAAPWESEASIAVFVLRARLLNNIEVKIGTLVQDVSYSSSQWLLNWTNTTLREICTQA